MKNIGEFKEETNENVESRKTESKIAKGISRLSDATFNAIVIVAIASLFLILPVLGILSLYSGDKPSGILLLVIGIVIDIFLLDLFLGEPSEASGPECFIATAAYGAPLNENLDILRSFRDTKLNTNILGRTFVNLYYVISPPIAQFISNHETLRWTIRQLINLLVFFIEDRS